MSHSVVQLAEHCLWSIWMQSGSEEGNRHLAAAVGCMKTGDHAAAIKVLDALVAREPEFAEAHFQRGLALAAADQTAEAEDAYRQALRLNPYHFGAAAALGHACVERGHLQAALHFYRQALRIHPQLEDVPDAVHEVECVIEARRGNVLSRAAVAHRAKLALVRLSVGDEFVLVRAVVTDVNVLASGFVLPHVTIDVARAADRALSDEQNQRGLRPT